MHWNWTSFLPCSNPYHREHMIYHLILLCFALFILNCQFLHTPYAWPSWQQSLSQVCWSHILLIESSALQGRTDINQCSEGSAWWMWTFISAGFLPKVLPPYFTHSSSHSHGKMGETSDRPDGNACSSGFGFHFLLFYLLLHHLAWHVSPWVLIWLAV